jgi:hypothetical protein
MLGEDENWLYELAIDTFPEDACLRVYGVGEHGETAFTADERAAGRAPPQAKSTK